MNRRMTIGHEVRDRSKRLFGNRYMLEVCVAVARASDRVSLTHLATDGNVSPSLYSSPVSRLLQLGLLVEAPRADDDHRARWYKPAQSSLWQAAQELAE